LDCGEVEKEMIIGIPVPCPNCGGKLVAVSWDVSWAVLKKRSWHVCRNCNYECPVDDFKKELCCA